ncbi:MAG: hypothetical protein LBS50_02920, partial [Prevotellaceae bacterium]|nr:hypothetical protein [Prevotellaceae bacterium]
MLYCIALFLAEKISTSHQIPQPEQVIIFTTTSQISSNQNLSQPSNMAIIRMVDGFWNEAPWINNNLLSSNSS